VQDSREEVRHSQEEVQDTYQHTTVHLTVHQTGHPTDLQAGWLESLAGKIGTPNAAQLETLKALAKTNGFPLLKTGVLRATATLDFGGMKFPWAKITPALPEIIKEISETHNWRYANDSAYRAEWDKPGTPLYSLPPGTPTPEEEAAEGDADLAFYMGQAR
jgi:hypothetical protein